MARLGLAPAIALTLSGCANLAYYTQAVSGHLEIMRAARPIEAVQRDAATDPSLKQKLDEVRAIRDFASRELALPDNGSYRAYADLGRPFVVWNVFAAPEFSVEPEKWCMLIVGCVGYRGYYDRRQAEQLARELQAQGFDTHVGGVPAYSTLGHFDDPVLNTFLRLGSIEVARLIFHELAHQQVFVNGDSTFNESFASAVENEGVRRWLARHGTLEQDREFALQRQRKATFVELVGAYRGKLRELYALDLPAEDKRRAKAEVMIAMQGAYRELHATLGGPPAYEKWFEHDLNNAKIASLALYTQLLPAFEAVLAEEDDDLPRFYRRVAVLAGLPAADRRAALDELQHGATPVAQLSSTLRPQPVPDRYRQ